MEGNVKRHRLEVFFVVLAVFLLLYFIADGTVGQMMAFYLA